VGAKAGSTLHRWQYRHHDGTRVITLQGQGVVALSLYCQYMQRHDMWTGLHMMQSQPQSGALEAASHSNDYPLLLCALRPSL
jgi:hypothetical protein